MKLLVLTSLLAFFFGVSAFASESNDPLVSIFCDAVVKRSYDTSMVDDGLAWAQLRNQLEHRAHDPEVRRLDPVAYDECIKSHQAEFEDGEFILGGKELLKQSARTGKSANHAPLTETAEVQIPEFGKISIREDLSSDAQVSNVDVKQRESRYNELWNSFLDRLHGEFSPRRAAANLPIPPRD